MKPIRLCVVTAITFFAVSAGSAWAQRGSGGQVTSPAPSGAGTMPSINSNRSNFPMGRDPMMGPSGMPDIMNTHLAEQQAKIRNTERQKKLQSETDKLVDLAKELNKQVGNETAPSPADLGKRAEEIEKLAKSVKERMKG